MLEIGMILDDCYVAETGLAWNLRDENGVIDEYRTREEAEEDLNFIARQSENENKKGN